MTQINEGVSQLGNQEELLPFRVDLLSQAGKSMSETSRVNREIYARFCEGLGVKFPRPTRQVAKKKNTTKSKVRAKVEHVFRILKHVFGFEKVRFRGAGNDTFIVLEDFDPKLAAKFAVQGRMTNAGQACVGSKRFIVVEAIADQFLGEVMRLLATYVPGDPANEATTLAPLSSKAAQVNLLKQVAEAVENGATLLTGGTAPEGQGHSCCQQF